MQLEQLEKFGIDTQDGIKRFMGNSGLYERMLKKLPQAVAEAHVAEDFAKDDYEQALADAHTLKGVTGNLSVTPLYQAYSEVVALLRANEPERAKQRFFDIQSLEQKIVRYIESGEV